MAGSLIGWRFDVDACGWAGGVVVGRGVAGRGARAAGGSCEAGSGAVRFGAVGAGRAGVGARRAWLWPAVDRDVDVRAFDGGQAAHGLGLRNAGARGLRLVASAALLFDRDRPARARRIDDPQTGAQARRDGGRGDYSRCDREGSARDALSGSRRPDRLDRGRGGYPLSIGRDARAGGRAGARARGAQGRAYDQREGAGHRSLALDRPGGRCARSPGHSRGAPARPGRR